MMTGNLPTGLWLEIKLKDLTAKAVPYYILQKGNHGSGLVMLKLNALDGRCKLLAQQRNFETDQLEWAPALDQEIVEEPRADDYIRRSAARDPDLWVVEIEARGMENVLED